MKRPPFLPYLPLLLAALLAYSPAFAQTPAAQTLGGSDNDYLYSLLPTAGGAYILGGFSCSPAGGDKSEGPRGGYDFWVVKSDATGTVLWEKAIGGDDGDMLLDMKQLADEKILLAGSSRSGAGSGERTAANQGDWDYWLVQLGPDGTVETDLSIGGPGADLLAKVRLDQGQNRLIGGSSLSGAGGDKTEASFGGYDYWLVKTDDQGTIIWDKSFGGSGDDFLADVLALNDGGYLLAGWSTSGTDGNKTSPSYGGGDLWLIKLDSNGDKQWEASFGGDQKDQAAGVLEDTGGNIYLAGYSGSGASGNKTSAAIGGRDFWLLKLDADGNILWDKSFGGTADEELNALAFTPGGELLLAGTTRSGAGGHIPEEPIGGSDFLLLHVNAIGELLESRRFGGSRDDIGTAVFPTADGFVLGGASSSSNSGNVSGKNKGWMDYWAVEGQFDPPPQVEDQAAFVCSGAGLSITLNGSTNATPVASYAVSVTDDGGLAAANDPTEGAGLSADALAADAWTNTGSMEAVVEYTIVPLGENGKEGDAFTLRVTVHGEGAGPCPGGLPVSLIVYLQGAYDTGTGLMRDDLRTSDLLPLNEPYAALGYTSVGGGGESTAAAVFQASGPDAIVDWVWLELRGKSDAAMVLATRSALLQRDGDVVDVDGLSPVSFAGMAPDEYFVAVKHRNHLGAMSAAPVALSGSAAIVDLTAGLGDVSGGANGIAVLGDGSLGLFSGDFDHNGQVQNTDSASMLPTLGTSGYTPGDLDLNSQVQNTDLQLMLIPNIGRGAALP